MPMTVDDLRIEINAQAVKANDAIDKLDDKLNTLQQSLGNLDASKLASFGNAVNRLSQGMSSLKVDKISKADFTRLAGGIEQIASVDATTIERAASSMHRLTNALGSLKNVDVAPTSKQVADLAKGISQLGYKSATRAIDNIPKLAQRMSELMNTLSRAPKVSQNLIDMTNALAKLARTGASSGKAATSLGKSLDSYTASTGRARRGTFSLAGALGKLYASYWLIFRAFGKLGESINLASSLTEVENVVNTTFGEYASLVDKMADTSIADFGMSELTTKQVASRFQAMGTAMEIPQKKIAEASDFLEKKGVTAYGKLGDSMADVSISLTKLTADMASFYNVEQEAVAEDLAAIITGETRPLRTYGLDLTQATIAEWAMKQGLDANIQSMSQAEKAMLRYQYVLANTSEVQGDFAKTANTWANQIRILKQNLEALGIVVGKTLINALKPLVTALNKAMSHIIAFAETVSNALGKIFGWQFESGSGGGIVDEMADSADSSEDIASGLGTAADNAKKLKSNLLGIDELNVLEPDTDTDTSSGTSSGSISSAIDASGGQWTKTETIWESEIDSLFELGEYIGQILTDALNSIPWDEVYQGARNFGKGLADFLNGLISPELFGAVGRTIAGALNTAIYAALEFGKNFDFYGFGESIATGINEFFGTFDFESLAETLNVWVDGIKDSIAGFLDTLTWEKIISATTTFLGTLELDTVAVLVGAFALKNNMESISVLFTKALYETLGPMAGFKIAFPIILTGFLFKVEWDIQKEMEENEENISIWGEDKAREMSGNKWIDKVAWMRYDTEKANASVTADYASFLEDWGSKLKTYQTETEATNKAFVEGNASAFDEAKNNSQSFFEDWKSKLATYQSDTEKKNLEMKESYKTTFSNAKTSISGFFSDWGSKLKTHQNNVDASNQLVIQSYTSFFTNMGTKLSEWWETSVKPWFALEKWQEIFGNIGLALDTKWNELVAWWSESAIGVWWTEHVQPWFTKEKWQTELDNVKSAFKTKWDETVGKWKTDIQTWWTINVQPWFTKKRWTELLQSIADAFRDKFQEAREWVEEKVQKMYDFVSDIVGKITSIIGSIGQAISGVIEGAKSIGSSIGASLGISVNATGFASGGFPERSSLFFAGEHGIPELLGTVGGRTAVAGGDEITGIRQAVYDTGNAETALMETMISLLQVIAEKETSFELDGRELITAIDERRARNGFSFAT